MAQVYNRLTLDVKKKNHDIITAVQNDANSRYLDINLIDNGVNINLTGHEVRLYAKKPDQQEIFNNGQITNAEQGRVQIELTSQLLAKEGYVEAQVIIYKNNQQILSTLPFKIHVVSNLMSDNAIESSNEYGALVILYQNLYEAYDLMTTMVQRIGTPGTVAQQNNLDTMFEVWEWMVNYMRQNGTAGLIDKINAIKNNTDLLTNNSYGLSVIKNAIGAIKGDFWGRTHKTYKNNGTIQNNSNGQGDSYERNIMEITGGPFIIANLHIDIRNNPAGIWKIYIDGVTIFESLDNFSFNTLKELFKAPYYCNSSFRITVKRNRDSAKYQNQMYIDANYYK